MAGWRERIEDGFRRLADGLFRHAVWALAGILLLVVALAAQLPKLVLDTSTEGFLHEDDPTLLAYNAYRAQFGRDEMLFIAVEAPDVFAPATLSRLQVLHGALEAEVPHIDDITSLVNARNTRGDAGALIVEDLMQRWPENEAQIAELRARALANPLYRNLLLSEDGRVTAIVIKTNAYSGSGTSMDEALGGFDDAPAEPAERAFLTDAENSAVVAKVREIAARHDGPDFRIRVGGSPVVTDALKQAMQQNMRKFLLLAIGAIAIVLGLLFRRASGVVLPIVVVVLTLVSTLGLMALAGIPIKVPTQILPSFLLAVGVGASVHVLAVFYRRLHALQAEAIAPEPRAARRAAIVYALGHSGLAIVMTSVTTAAGLASFAGAEVAPIADLGLVAAIGVLISLVYTLILVPALLALLPIRAQRGAAVDQRHRRMDAILIATANLATRHYRRVLAVSALLIVFGIAGLAQVRFSHTPFKWFPESHAVRQATDFIDARMKGASSLEVIVDTGEEDGLYDPARLAALEKLQREVGALDRGELFVGKTLAATDIVKEINQALNENRAEAYSIPTDRALVAQEFLLFSNSGSDDLEDFVDSRFSKARFTVKMPWVDSVLYQPFIAELEARFRAALPGVDIGVTGMAALLGRTMHAAIVSMAESYLWAAAAITVMMVLLIGNLRVGLVAMIPNLAPIVLTLGLMGWLGLPLDLFTMLIGSIAIGLVVDDTIHFMHNYRRYHHETGDVPEAVRRTLLTTGRAMLVTTVVLVLGFLVFAFSALTNLVSFGLLTAFAVLTALLADFFLAPALMMQLHASRVLPEKGDY